MQIVITILGRVYYVTHWTLAFSMLLASIASACSGLAGRDRFSGKAVSQQETREERARIIESLAPEDALISRIRLAAVVDAMATVIKDVDKDRFPQTVSAVRQVLRDASLQDLRRIERILPEVEKRRKQEGID
jgi:hypothetical protein